MSLPEGKRGRLLVLRQVNQTFTSMSEAAFV